MIGQTESLIFVYARGVDSASWQCNAWNRDNASACFHGKVA